MEEKEFKNYKEKQAFYKMRTKQSNMVWESKEPVNEKKKNTIIKGRTYINPDRQDRKRGGK